MLKVINSKWGKKALEWTLLLNRFVLCFLLCVLNLYLQYMPCVEALRLWQISATVPSAKRGRRYYNFFVSHFSNCYGRISNIRSLSLVGKLITKYTLFGTCSCRQHNILWFPQTVSGKLLLQCSWRDWTS